MELRFVGDLPAAFDMALLLSLFPTSPPVPAPHSILQVNVANYVNLFES